MKRLKSYVNVNWEQLQEDMKEHWRDSDTSQQRGTRAYLEAYVRECSQTFPGISEYYTNFLVISDACILAKQVHESEQGYLFVRGLPRADKEEVFMRMENGPKEIDVGTFDMDRIYNFVRRLYCQREGIMQTSFSQAEEDARRAQIAVEASRRVTPSDIRAAVKDLQANRRLENKSTLPQGVDQEVQDLIDAMAGTKISTAEVESLAKHPAVGPLLREGKNYVYFLSQVTYASASPLPETTNRPRAILSRNDGSFLTEQPRNVYNQQGGGNYQGQGKPSPSNSECNMCNERGHYVKDCELYRNLNKMGWISYTFDRDTRQVTYYYGLQHKQFGEIKGPVPYRNQLYWLKEKIRDFFEVTDDMLDQPASSVKAEMFDGMDSLTIKQRGARSPAPEDELAEFQERRMFPSHDPEPLISLDYIDARDIVLAEPNSGQVHSTAFAATRLQEKSNQNTDRVLEQARPSRIQKPATKKPSRLDEERLSDQFSETPTL
ncbi:hypothetical protein EJ02DRAFT_458333 [Clathrospora elynae]|uniref:CCHC-type domain-containing protein n=1 Tax=Clathrospora elynae TaxID=706981 RepID=A0A6A5SE38_9PLEO|nr:hypothetical protein EJ02DRAFT_458333 [Clathrospora elynae]